MQHMFYTCADVVIIGGGKNLRFAFKPPERLGVDNFCLVAEVIAPEVRLCGVCSFFIKFITLKFELDFVVPG